DDAGEAAADHGNQVAVPGGGHRAEAGGGREVDVVGEREVRAEHRDRAARRFVVVDRGRDGGGHAVVPRYSSGRRSARWVFSRRDAASASRVTSAVITSGPAPARASTSPVGATTQDRPQ